jgi:hypothetical protein
MELLLLTRNGIGIRIGFFQSSALACFPQLLSQRLYLLSSFVLAIFLSFLSFEPVI